MNTNLIERTDIVFSGSIRPESLAVSVAKPNSWSCVSSQEMTDKPLIVGQRNIHDF
jgi:hypothetical protein